MSFIVDLCRFAIKQLRSVLFMSMSIAGLVTAAVVGSVTFIVALFTDFDYTTDIVAKIDLAASYVAEQFGVLHQNSSPVIDILVSFLAVDTFVECMVLLVTVTVALVVSTLCTFVAGIVAVAGSILVIRGILKLIRVCTAGVADP